jgi:glycosyltransferase involved in cell wall biosynthesis
LQSLNAVDFELIYIDDGSSDRSLPILETIQSRDRQVRVISFTRGMVTWVGFKQVPLAYTRQARHRGQTKYPFGKMVRFAADGLLSFSMTPLRLAI